MEHFEGQSNEGHGWYPGSNMADALVECAKLLRTLNETLGKVFSGGVAFNVSVRFWPPGLEGKFEVKK